MRDTKEIFVKRLQEKYSEPFSIIRYDGFNKEGTFKCGYCKEEYTTNKMGNLLDRRRKHVCPKCFLVSDLTQDVLDEFKLWDNLIFIRFDFSNEKKKPTILYKCKTCRRLSRRTYKGFLEHPFCKHCAESNEKNVSKTLRPLVPKDYEYVKGYRGQNHRALFRHKCGFIFSVRLRDLRSGAAHCPKCFKRPSKGVEKISQTLSKLDIQFENGKEFAWSKREKFDFYLPTYNLLIEYYGVQHYKKIKGLCFEKQQRIDTMKNNGAKRHGLEVFIISYEQLSDIEDILVQRLKENT